MRLGRHFSSRQIIGGRESQQDFCKIVRLIEPDDEEALLVVLADGMGGHAGGAQASRIAVHTFIEEMQRNGEARRQLEHLKKALDHANIAVGHAANDDPGLAGMGTTLVGAIIRRDHVSWVSVGDSPLWLWRNGSLIRLNEDHSIGGQLKRDVAEGRISSVEAANHPQRNVLLAAVTGEALAAKDIDVKSYGLKPEDVLLLASDGLETLDEEEIAGVIFRNRSASAAELADHFLEEVENRRMPRQDNTTAMIVRVASQKRRSRLQPETALVAVGIVLSFSFVSLLSYFAVSWLRSDLATSDITTSVDPKVSSSAQEQAPNIPGPFLDVDPSTSQSDTLTGTDKPVDIDAAKVPPGPVKKPTGNGGVADKTPGPPLDVDPSTSQSDTITGAEKPVDIDAAKVPPGPVKKPTSNGDVAEDSRSSANDGSN